MVRFKLVEWVTNAPIREGEGSRHPANDIVSLVSVPHSKDMLSFGGRAWEVVEVWHVHAGEPRLLVREVSRAAGGRDRPEIAELSRR